MRPSVKWFGEQMEAKLRANDHKGGWQYWSAWDALECLRDETEELVEAMRGRIQCECHEAGCSHWPVSIPEEVIAECADIANFAMMIAEMVKGCPHGNRGMDESD